MGRVSMPQGKGSQTHNRREYGKIGRAVPDHIDVSRSHENVTLIDMDIRDAYQGIFGKALAEYNSKQKRADRKIHDYCDHVRKSKNGEKLFYEDVVQWGSKEDFQNSPETRQKACEALIEYASTFEARNPNLRLVGAYIHMDEASPHLHLDYVPTATGYKSGLAVRNSLDRAMKEMGFVPTKESRQNNATKLWKENERAVFAEICRSKGLEVEAERKARGSLSVEEYKEAKDAMMGDIEQEYEEKKAQLEKMDEVATYVATEGQKAIAVEDMTIPAKKTLLGKIEAPERIGVFVENMNSEQVAALMRRVEAADRLEEAIERTQEHCSELIAAATKDASEIRASASADRNATIAKAEETIRERDNIMARAQAWAANLMRQYSEIVAKVKHLLGSKERLEAEVSDLQAKKALLEPLRVEVQELTRAKDIMTGAVENEINQSRFHEPVGGFGSRDYKMQWDKLDRGELLALYRDGTLRTVTRNEKGGFDNKTLADTDAGLCRIGWFVTEERVTVPRNLLKELISKIDRSQPISKNLAAMIEQQNTVSRVTEKITKDGHDR